MRNFRQTLPGRGLAATVGVLLELAACKPRHAEPSSTASALDPLPAQFGTYAVADFPTEPLRSEMIRNGYPYDLARADLLKRNLPAEIDLDEAIAVYAYTHDSYKRINSALRTKDAPELGRHRNQILAIVSALNKLPAFSCVVYRYLTLPAEVSLEFVKGFVHTEAAFVSTTISPMPSNDYLFGMAEVMKISSPACKEISAVSHFGSEQEILFPPGSRFLVGESWAPRTVTHEGKSKIIRQVSLSHDATANVGRSQLEGAYLADDRRLQLGAGEAVRYFFGDSQIAARWAEDADGHARVFWPDGSIWWLRRAGPGKLDQLDNGPGTKVIRTWSK